MPTVEDDSPTVEDDSPTEKRLLFYEGNNKVRIRGEDDSPTVPIILELSRDCRLSGGECRGARAATGKKGN